METATETTPVIDFDLQRILTLYGDGVAVSEIAASFNKSEQWVYSKLRSIPDKYEEAKQFLAEKRNSKYRRIGAMAANLQLETLEHCHKVLDDEQDYLSELETLETEAIENDHKGKLEKFEAEGDKSGVSPEQIVEIRKIQRRISLLLEMKTQAGKIRGQFKDFADIGEKAERRADLNEGKATSRIDGIQPQIVVFDQAALEAAKEAAQ